MVAALALAACGESGPAPQPSPTMGPGGKDFRAEVTKLPEPQQKVVFLRAILDAGQTCQGVNEAARQPDQNGNVIWLVRCEGAQDWLVALKADGTVNVTGPIGAETVPAGRATPR